MRMMRRTKAVPAFRQQPVLPSDAAARLAARGLVLEHQLYPKCVRALVEGRVRLVNGRTVMDDETARSLVLFG